MSNAHRLRLPALAALIAASALAAPSLPAQDSSIVIRAGRLLDGRGGDVRGATIVVRGVAITSVGTAAAGTAGTAGAATYDLSENTPGTDDAGTA